MRYFIHWSSSRYIYTRSRLPLTLLQADSAELKNAPEEVARLFRKSGSSSASSPDPSPDALAVLRQEMKDVQHSFSLANEVGSEVNPLTIGHK